MNDSLPVLILLVRTHKLANLLQKYAGSAWLDYDIQFETALKESLGYLHWNRSTSVTVCVNSIRS